MKDKLKKIMLVIAFLFLGVHLVVGVCSDLPNYKILYSSAGLFLCILANLFFTAVVGVLILFNYWVFDLLSKGKNSGKLKHVICLIITLVVYPFVILLCKPLTYSIGHVILSSVSYDKWYKCGIAIINLNDFHGYPALKILLGSHNWGVVVGFVVLIVLIIALCYINGAKGELDATYDYSLETVEHKEHLEITDTVTYSGILNPKTNHEIHTKIVDDTQYPIHGLIGLIVLSIITTIITPYLTFVALVVRQIVSLCQK